MKKMRNGIYTGIAVMCVILGLLLPNLVFHYLDAGGAGEVKTFVTDAVTVEVPFNILDYLRLAESSYEVYPVDNNAALKSSPDEIFDSALEVLKLLGQYEKEAGVHWIYTEPIVSFIDLFTKKSEGYKRIDAVMVAAQLEISSEKSYIRSGAGGTQAVSDIKKIPMTAVLWKCQMWDGTGNLIEMVLEDTSKMLVSFKVVLSNEMIAVMTTEMSNEKSELNKNSVLRCLTYGFARFSQEYYGMGEPTSNILILEGDNGGNDGGIYESGSYAIKGASVETDMAANDRPPSGYGGDAAVPERGSADPSDRDAGVGGVPERGRVDSSDRDAGVGGIPERGRVDSSDRDATVSESGSADSSAWETTMPDMGSIPDTETYARENVDGERTLETADSQGEGAQLFIQIVEDGSYAFLEYDDGSGDRLKLPVSLDFNVYSFNSTSIRTSTAVKY